VASASDGDGARAASVTLDSGETKIVAFTPGGTFGQATRTRDARQAQFGLKVLF
jgi:hypothetical protein